MFKSNVLLLTFVGAHKPVPASTFTSKAAPADFDHIAALGDAYHNAWRLCYERTVNWLVNDMQVKVDDPAYQNDYYTEYSIITKVPEAYEIFEQLLGEGNYYPAPVFSSEDFDQYNKLLAQRSLAQQEGDENVSAPFQLNAGQEWIAEKFGASPEDKTIEFYGGKDPADLGTWGEPRNTLKKLFYNIQQTGYYCDFTLESGQFSFEKIGDFDKAKQVEAERDEQKAIWKFILSKHVSPMRWSMKMWTRFNIAMSSVEKMKSRFENNWDAVCKELERIDAPALAGKLGWEDYEERLAEHNSNVQTWIEKFQGWIDSCEFERPSDDVLKTGSKTCLDGIESSDISEGEEQAIAMYKDFVTPLVEEYQRSEADDGEAVEDLFYGNIMKLGHPHSFRCEFVFIRTRVRIFEIIPTWEIERVAVDAENYFAEIKDFRNTLVGDVHQIAKEGLYSDTTLLEMEAKMEEIVGWLTKWAAADSSVYDLDQELHRRETRKQIGTLADMAKDIYDWYYMMGYSQFKWKEGRPHDMVSDNYLWADATAKYVRPFVTSNSRKYWRQRVWRELVKFEFHLLRRI